MAQSAGSHGCHTLAPMLSAKPRWSALGLSPSWCPLRAALAPLCRIILAAESQARDLSYLVGAKRPYSFLKGSEAAGDTHTCLSICTPLRRLLLAGGTSSAVPHWRSLCWWMPQMCQGRRSRDVGMCSPAAGHWLGCAPSPDPGGTFAFVSL